MATLLCKLDHRPLFNDGQSSQVHWGSTIHILKISSYFYILLLSLRAANLENFSSISLFIQVLWLFEYFRLHLIFLVMRIFSISGSYFQKFPKLQSLKRYFLKYMPKLLQERVQNTEFYKHEIFCGYLKIRKS